MILGTWNLQVYPPRYSARGNNVAYELGAHTVDVWFLTELHADWEMKGYTLGFCQPNVDTGGPRRLAAIATQWNMDPVTGPNDPAERWACLAHLTNPQNGKKLLAVSSVLPWRGMPSSGRYFDNRDMSYAEAFQHLLDYMVQRIADERRPDEDTVWGGDFNQGLSGRDHVGTHRGRAALLEALKKSGLQAATAYLPAMIHAHPAIDHICIPASWSIRESSAVYRPMHTGRPLSDHALYVVEALPPASSSVN